MSEFSYFIFYQSLMDLPVVGGTFTWSNNQEYPYWSRIDRFLVSSEWEAQFLGVSQRRLPRLFSDHLSILLDCGDFHRGRPVVGHSNL
jgi:endonuclease/exonuclease/phosphatase family metal-dependent hydrolase